MATSRSTIPAFVADMTPSYTPPSDTPQSAAEMHSRLARAFHSERLVFRCPESPGDDEFVLAINANSDAAISSSIGVPKPPSVQAGQEWIKWMRETALLGVIVCLDPAKPLPDPPLAPEMQARVQADRDAARPTPIGIIHMRNPYPASAVHHRQGEIGIDILAPFQGRGYGGEAIRWVTEWGFTMAGLHRVVIRVFGWNERAIGLYRKLGWRLEAHEVEALWFAGRWWDNLNFAMLDREWQDTWRDRWRQQAASVSERTSAPKKES